MQWGDFCKICINNILLLGVYALLHFFVALKHFDLNVIFPFFITFVSFIEKLQLRAYHLVALFF